MADALSRTLRAAVILTRNGSDYHEQEFYDPKVTYSEIAHQRIVLSTNMGSPSEVDMAGVATGATLFVETDRAVNVAINAASNVWTVSENGALMLVGSFTHLYLQNESTTNQATVDVIITD